MKKVYEVSDGNRLIAVVGQELHVLPENGGAGVGLIVRRHARFRLVGDVMVHEDGDAVLHG